MIKRILRIAKLLDIRRSTYSSQKTDVIEIVIRFPISEEAGRDPHYPKGSVTAHAICFGVPNVNSIHMIGDVTDKFDLTAYLREWEDAAKVAAEAAKNFTAFREGARVRICGGDYASRTGVVLQFNGSFGRVQIDDTDQIIDARAGWMELID